jgi:hypothetical protein
LNGEQPLWKIRKSLEKPGKFSSTTEGYEDREKRVQEISRPPF